MPDILDVFLATAAGRDQRAIEILKLLGMSSIDAQRLVQKLRFNPQQTWAELRAELVASNLMPPGFDPLPFGIGTVPPTKPVKRSI